MQLGWLPSLFFYIMGILIIAITFKTALKKQPTYKSNDWKEQLQKEHELQFIRNKPLESNLFLKIDFKQIPIVDNDKCKRDYLSLIRYADSPMINLKNKSNMDLKSQYGPQVVEHVSDYERNFIGFMQSAIRYSESLLAENYIAEAQKLLELCAAYHCDISKCYLLLIDIYKSQHNSNALLTLKQTINTEMSDSPFLNKVLNQLNENLKESV